MAFSDLPLLKDSIIRALDVPAIYEDAISAMLGESVRLSSPDSSGWHPKVRCPLHNDQHPSFSVNSITGGFKCWASGCNQAGSLFDFWCLYRGLRRETDFAKALAELADLAKIDVKEWQQSKQYKTATTHAKEHSQTKFKAETQVITQEAEAVDIVNLPIDHKIVEEFQSFLGPDEYQYLSVKRGLTIETIKKYKIGWNPQGRAKTAEGSWALGRFTIPVYNQQGECRNIRSYSQYAASAYKMLNYKPDPNKPGYGKPARLFGLYALTHRSIHTVCICEGELDTILLNQKLEEAGLSDWLAITNTHGAGTFRPEWLEPLYDKAIYFLYDCDEAGRIAAASHCSKYFLGPLNAGRFTAVKNITLPLEGTKEDKDITDYFVKWNYQLEQLLATIQATPPLESGGVTADEAVIPPIEIDNLSEALQNRAYIDQRVKVPLTIVGDTSTRYHAVRSYRVTFCPLATQGGNAEEGECCSDLKEKFIPYGHDTFIHSSLTSGPALMNKLRSMSCTKSQKCSVEIVKKVVMEQYFAQQTIKRFLVKENTEGRMENVHNLSDVNVYFLQPEKHMAVEPRDYLATGWIRSHPVTSVTTLFIEELEPLANDWENFRLTDQVKEELKIFAEMPFYDILTDISDHVTRIYNSPRILAAVLLAYCSPIWINFNGSIVRGWINACIIGDTGVGKSTTYMRIADYIDVGDIFSMLSGSRTGLLYSMQKKGDDWKLHVGRYVSCDRKIIAIDETQESEPHDLKSMAIAMDSGQLDIAKVQKGTYSTRTRTILLMNAPTGKTLADYSHGCLALTECFDPMFIRRLDLAVFCPSGQDNAFYNQSMAEFTEGSKISARALRHLIFWAWTRKSADIQWEPEATQYCLSKATELANEYGDAISVPLLNPADCRLTLARLSTAHAILTGQFNENMEGCIVRLKNVIEIVALLKDMYSDPVCGLSYYSNHSKQKNVLKNEDYERIKLAFDKLIRGTTSSSKGQQRYGQSEKLFCQLLVRIQSGDEIRVMDMKDHLCASARWTKYHYSILASFKMVDVGKFGYKTTPKFNRFMSRWVDEDWLEYDQTGTPRNMKVREMLDMAHSKQADKMIQELNDPKHIESVTNDEFYEAQYKQAQHNQTQDNNGKNGKRETEDEEGSVNDPQADPFFMEFNELDEM